MGFSTLTWHYDSAAGDGFRIYRSATPMDPEALPTPLDTVAITEREYVDATVVADSTYYYRVSVYSGAIEHVSEELVHIAEDSGDDFWSSVLSLKHFDTALTDEVIAGVAWAFDGGVSIDAVDYKFGSGGYSNNSSGRVRTTSTGPRNIGSNAFTWDAWIKCNGGVNGLYNVFTLGADSTTSGRVCEVLCQVNSTATQAYLAFYGTAVSSSLSIGSGVRTPGTPIVIGQWHYVECSVTPLVSGQRVFRIFIDGVKVLETTRGSTSMSSSGYSIGRGYYTANRYWLGKMDEVRLTQAVRHTADYAVPTAAPPEFGT